MIFFNGIKLSAYRVYYINPPFASLPGPKYTVLMMRVYMLFLLLILQRGLRNEVYVLSRKHDAGDCAFGH